MNKLKYEKFDSKWIYCSTLEIINGCLKDASFVSRVIRLDPFWLKKLFFLTNSKSKRTKCYEKLGVIIWKTYFSLCTNFSSYPSIVETGAFSKQLLNFYNPKSALSQNRMYLSCSGDVSGEMCNVTFRYSSPSNNSRKSLILLQTHWKIIPLKDHSEISGIWNVM